MKCITDTIDLAVDNYVEEAFPNVKKGMCEFVLSNGSFSVIDVIDYILETTGTANIDISTWVASGASIKHIINFLEDNRIHGFRFLIDSMIKKTRVELYEHIQRYFPDKIALTTTHAKFTIIYNEDFNFVIETSANLNKNSRLESFRITEDKEYCDFFRNAFDDIYHKSRENGGFTHINDVYR